MCVSFECYPKRVTVLPTCLAACLTLLHTWSFDTSVIFATCSVSTTSGGKVYIHPLHRQGWNVHVLHLKLVRFDWSVLHSKKPRHQGITFYVGVHYCMAGCNLGHMEKNILRVLCRQYHLP